MRKFNIGLSLRNNYWDEIEAYGSMYSVGENGRAIEDGFSVWGERRNNCRDCGDPLEDHCSSRCDACRFIYMRETSINRIWHRLSLEERQMYMLRRNAESSLPLRRKLLCAVGRLAQVDIRNTKLKNLRDRRLDLAVRRVYCFINYRLEHKPQSYYRGENNRGARLNTAAVLDIRANYAPIQGFSCYAFAAKYEVSIATIQQVIHGSTWKHIGGRIVPVVGSIYEPSPPPSR